MNGEGQAVAILRELVRLKRIKEEIEAGRPPARAAELREEYERGKSIAWMRAKQFVDDIAARVPGARVADPPPGDMDASTTS